ncbi:putative ModE family transcriptional regulator [Caenibius tardaugens NBRC 16725]|uniref:Putative ModE family transcriptional regulator n=1 Tax=Caenibius tardaugens NBRC 16725 TaxID=1219035 RepID=U2YI62_9SPHN|nr:LysR family transcriptional regulator [Caenibius tardaugens]AZI37036.1 LysR family transcriptional regulator [Caenibius tardaugens NBRC 16725]GAD47737.1 putative ModE family transcriptional regulator [Caenibius tardaugens NBRC 16725]
MEASLPIKIKLQLMCGEEIAMGPGKADLLEAIRDTGSISRGGRAMGMSYRRAWLLVDTMNRCWREPLVETSPGSHHGGGARLTVAGVRVLALYRTLQDNVARTVQGVELAELQAAMRKAPKSSQKD